MTWSEQVRGIKRQLASKGQARIQQIKHREQRATRALKNAAPVIVRGEVTPAFLERMRAMGVRVDLKS